MTIKELEIFLELSERQNVLKTAEALSLSQSAVSQGVKSLENKLGERLFDRIGKKLVLNERGRKFKEMTLGPYNRLMDARYRFVKEKISGNLTISASKTTGAYILPEIIFEYLLNNQNVSITKNIENSKTIIEKIKNAELDIGFIETETEEKFIVKEKIKEDELIIVSSVPHKDVFIDELKNRKWLLREEGSGTRETFLSQTKNITNFKIFMEYNDFEEIKTLLLNHPETVTCISKTAVENELQNKTLFEIKIKNLKFKRNFYLIYHKNKTKTRLFEDFRNFVLKHTKLKA
ncbi:LysR substrate-binding domain-containing protein [Nautilia sp.]